MLGTALGTGLGGTALVVVTHGGASLSDGVRGAFLVAGAGAVLALATSKKLPFGRVEGVA